MFSQFALWEKKDKNPVLTFCGVVESKFETIALLDIASLCAKFKQAYGIQVQLVNSQIIMIRMYYYSKFTKTRPLLEN